MITTTYLTGINVKRTLEKMTEIKPYIEPKHNIKIGDIFYNSWGYDQTNIDFYQVVATTAKTITLRAIKSSNNDYNAYYMTGSKLPAKDNFCSDELIRKNTLFNGRRMENQF